MAVLVGRHIVHAVGEMKYLRIAQTLRKLLDASVDVTGDDVDLLHHLAVERCAETHHAVGRRMLRADVDHILVVLEHLAGSLDHLSVGVERIRAGVVLVLLVLEANRVERRVGVIILAERMSHPVVAQEEAAHVGMSDELDAEHVVDLAFLEIGHLPEAGNGMDVGVVARCAHHLDRQHLPVARSACEVIDDANRLLPVHAHHGGEHVEAEFLLQSSRELKPVLLIDVDLKRVALVERGVGIYL